jgi:hypothetical protein
MGRPIALAEEAQVPFVLQAHNLTRFPEQTVKDHVASIFRKLEVNDRTKAAPLAVRLGLGGKTPL